MQLHTICWSKGKNYILGREVNSYATFENQILCKKESAISILSVVFAYKQLLSNHQLK